MRVGLWLGLFFLPLFCFVLPTLPQEYNWSEWTDWSPQCSVSCGKGMHCCTRNCQNGLGITVDVHKCDGLEGKAKKCKECMTYFNCPVDAGWSPWEPWSICAQKVGDVDCGPKVCLLYTSPSPRDLSTSRMPSSA